MTRARRGGIDNVGKEREIVGRGRAMGQSHTGDYDFGFGNYGFDIRFWNFCGFQRVVVFVVDF